MRVISGKYRGKKLKEFELDSTKPTTDRVKESIFNLIQFDVAGSVVLDLFAGTGGLGIEAISRGAKHVTFVDANIKAISIVKENLKGIEGDCKVVNQRSCDFLNVCGQSYDLVFLDPPYNTNLGVEAIDHLILNNMINESGIIIFETGEDKEFVFDYPGYSLTKKKYGTIAVYKIVKD